MFLYQQTERKASGYRLIATPEQLRALLAFWLRHGIDLEPERLGDVLPLLAAYYGGIHERNDRDSST